MNKMDITRLTSSLNYFGSQGRSYFIVSKFIFSPAVALNKNKYATNVTKIEKLRVYSRLFKASPVG
jgi:hypothetical protein